MDKKTYDYIWEGIIEPNIINLQEKISKEDFIKYDIVVEDLEVAKQRIFVNYNSVKERLKELYHYDNGNTERLIDTHKIAACFIQVVMEERIFKYSYKHEITDELFLSNAKLAYAVGLGIIYINLLYRYCKLGEDAIVEKLQNDVCIHVPQTTPGHDEYSLGREKVLALNDVFGNEFDILTYSDMLFWIEFYNRQLLENDINPQLQISGFVADSF